MIPDIENSSLHADVQRAIKHDLINDYFEAKVPSSIIKKLL